MSDTLEETSAAIALRLQAIVDDANGRLLCASEGRLRFAISDMPKEMLVLFDRTRENDPDTDVVVIPAALVALAAPVHFGSLIQTITATHKHALAVSRREGRQETQNAIKKALGL